MSSPWLPWLYQYGVGGLIFAGGLALALRAGAVRWRSAADRWVLGALVAGFLGFLLAHAGWILWAARP